MRFQLNDLNSDYHNIIPANNQNTIYCNRGNLFISLKKIKNLLHHTVGNLFY